ncbi:MULTISPECIES: ParB N-terminal domain-containing protein [Streptomyces]|uniref:ParB N-terminal domain-containing protein n=1 Tax=Streptomyces TaxID=1883 RepID=UPI00131A81E6|nr:ParB N-terminal domain-containing protein [Streptomyces griseus]
MSGNSSLKTMSVPAWPRPDKELPVVQLEVDWLRFSVINHRTRAEQLQEARQADRDDLFTRDPLGKEAQEAQLKILQGQEGFHDLKSDLKNRGQQEPAIVTADGILINGNRRSAAMRSLYLADDVRGARYVKCLVLPKDATSEELVDLETELQVAKDFRQDYTWINEALLIEELYDRENKQISKVADRVHRELSDVRLFLEKIQYVHQLVALSNGARGYVDFVGNESAFTELAKHIKNKPEAEAKAVKEVYFLGILAGVEYRNLRHLRRVDAAQIVLNEVEDDPSLTPVLEVATSAAVTDAEDDPFGELHSDDGAEVEPLQDLLQMVASARPEEAIELDDGREAVVSHVLSSLRGSITAASKEAAENTHDSEELEAPFKRADRAAAELRRMIEALPKARRYPKWDEDAFETKLQEIEGLLRKIKEL